MAILLASILYMVVLISRITPQKISPHTKEFPYEKFNNTYTLPDGLETTIYPCLGEDSRQYFIVRDAESFSLTVTPCAASITWTVHLRPLSDKGNSATASTFVTSYSGDLARTYTSDKPQPGVYVITVTTLKGYSSYRILATTTPYASYSCAPKVTKPGVKVQTLDRKSVRLTWQPVAIDATHDHPVKYCVSINGKANFRTHCSAYANIFGDKPVSVHGFVFPWQRCKIAPLDPAPPGEAYMHCVVNKTSYDVYSLAPSTEYFFDVFAVSLFNNRSTAYQGVKFTSKPPKDTKELKPGKVYNVLIKDSPHRSTFFSFTLSGKPRTVRVSFQPCQTGRMFVEVYRRRHLVDTVRVKSFKVIRLKRARSGKYFIKIRNNNRGLRTMKIGVFINKHTYPYPKLPKNNAMKIFKPACDSFTVAWFVTRDRQRYCLYVRKLTNNFYDLAGPSRTQCEPTSTPRGKKIFCKRFRAKSKVHRPMTYTVTGLERGTTYIVDMYVTIKKEQTLSYKTITAHTTHDCSR